MKKKNDIKNKKISVKKDREQVCRQVAKENGLPWTLFVVCDKNFSSNKHTN